MLFRDLQQQQQHQQYQHGHEQPAISPSGTTSMDMSAGMHAPEARAHTARVEVSYRYRKHCCLFFWGGGSVVFLFFSRVGVCWPLLFFSFSFLLVRCFFGCWPRGTFCDNRFGWGLCWWRSVCKCGKFLFISSEISLVSQQHKAWLLLYVACAPKESIKEHACASQKYASKGGGGSRGIPYNIWGACIFSHTQADGVPHDHGRIYHC